MHIWDKNRNKRLSVITLISLPVNKDSLVLPRLAKPVMPKACRCHQTVSTIVDCPLFLSLANNMFLQMVVCCLVALSEIFQQLQGLPIVSTAHYSETPIVQKCPIGLKTHFAQKPVVPKTKAHCPEGPFFRKYIVSLEFWTCSKG